MSFFRDDLLLIGPGNKNYTYMAQAVNKGVTLVGLWDRRHPGMADYIPVAVEHAIEPDTKLTFVGDVICFSTHLVNQHGLYTHPFSTSQLTVLRIQKQLISWRISPQVIYNLRACLRNKILLSVLII